MKNLATTMLALCFLVGCGGGQSSYDKCTDSKEHLWNKEIKGNQYEGNEAYWDAVKAC